MKRFIIEHATFFASILIFLVALFGVQFLGYTIGYNIGEDEGYSKGKEKAYKDFIWESRAGNMVTTGPVTLNCNEKELSGFTLVVVPEVTALSIGNDAHLTLTNSNFYKF